jgi:hypothetical protein
LARFRLRLGLFIGVIAAATACVAPAAALPPVAGAEYAIRWNPRNGGPATAGYTLALLKLRAKHTDRFSVDYYDVPPSPTVPPGFATILRQRLDAAGHATVTWKLRGDHALANWACPLRDARDAKAEVDVGFGSADAVTRRYSYSCASDDLETASSLLSARANGCPAEVTRKDAGRVRVEEWRLPGGAVLLEVSGNGADSAAALEQFRRQVVEPLLAAGIRPAQESKTDQFSRCP